LGHMRVAGSMNSGLPSQPHLSHLYCAMKITSPNRTAWPSWRAARASGPCRP
jgi:hypothetical protein